VPGQQAAVFGQVVHVGPVVANAGGPADHLGVGDGDGEAERAGDHAAGVVVVAEVSGHLIDGQPDRRQGGVQGVGEGVAGQDRAGGQLPGVVGEVGAGFGDQQDAGVVADHGRDVQGGDPLGVRAGGELAEQAGGDGGGCHERSLPGMPGVVMARLAAPG
jgi:hypothetical protein